jgi:hypothetical protein
VVGIEDDGTVEVVDATDDDDADDESDCCCSASSLRVGERGVLPLESNDEVDEYRLIDVCS